MLAAKLVDGPRIAVDCGCGAGSDIAFLRSEGFVVYTFDTERQVSLQVGKHMIGISFQ